MPAYSNANVAVAAILPAVNNAVLRKTTASGRQAAKGRGHLKPTDNFFAL
jgi:hypothetical protein